MVLRELLDLLSDAISIGVDATVSNNSLTAAVLGKAAVIVYTLIAIYKVGNVIAVKVRGAGSAGREKLLTEGVESDLAKLAFILRRRGGAAAFGTRR